VDEWMNRIIEKFRDNCRGFWRAYRWFIVAFVVAVFCDVASTVYFMTQESAPDEVHPAIRLVSRLLGPVIGPLVGGIGKAAAGIVVAIYCRQFAVYIFVLAAIISFWAAWYNVWGINIYEPNIVRWLPW